MTSQMQKFTLQQINAIMFAGFEYKIPDDTINMFNYFTEHIGSNAFINDNVFHKREYKEETSSTGSDGYKSADKRKRRGNKNMEMSGEDWDTIRSFQATKIEQKTGLNAVIDKLRLAMSKLSKEKYLINREQIMCALNEIMEIEPNVEILVNTVGNLLFDMMITNKTLLKLYTDLYTELIGTYSWLKTVIDQRFSRYMDLFKDMQYFDPDKDYDKFCDMNAINEKRKMTSQFFVGLSLNGVIPRLAIYDLLVGLLRMMTDYINQVDKKFEVDELTENMAILFNKEIIDAVEKNPDYVAGNYVINGQRIVELITKFAKSKAKDYKSLSNKSIFKCMDLVEM